MSLGGVSLNLQIDVRYGLDGVTIELLAISHRAQYNRDGSRNTLKIGLP